MKDFQGKRKIMCPRDIDKRTAGRQDICEVEWLTSLDYKHAL